MKATAKHTHTNSLGEILFKANETYKIVDKIKDRGFFVENAIGSDSFITNTMLENDFIIVDHD